MLKKLFKNEFSLGRVHDTVTIREGEERLKLRVDIDPMRAIAGLNLAQKQLQSIDENTTEEDQLNIAMYFASVMFGKEQAEKLSEFYRNDPGCLINIFGKYFTGRLSKLITKAQKKK